jgi:DNA-binding FadR family transcriptional regulator
MATEPVVRRKLADEVRDRLVVMIRTEMRPGDRLPSERALMEKFGVGRPAVREALQSLGLAGLIEIHHGERARVTVPDTRLLFERMGETMVHLLHSSPATLEDLKEARILFEVGMIRIAAQMATSEDVERLAQVLEFQRAAARSASEFIKHDMRFHTAIAGVTGNRVYALLSEAMLDWLFHFRRELLRVPGSEEITLSEHERLLQAVQRHDPEEAERAMREHLSRASERYRLLE